MESGFVPLFLWVHVPECILESSVPSSPWSPPHSTHLLPTGQLHRNLLQLPRHILLLLIANLQSWRWASITFVQKTFLPYSSRDALAQSSKARSSPFLCEALAGVPSPWNELSPFSPPTGLWIFTWVLIFTMFGILWYFLTPLPPHQAKWDGIQGSQWKSLMERLHAQSHTIS